MSSQFGFVSEDTFAEKMDTQNAILTAILDSQGGQLMPTSWNNVQALVRAGLASRVFAIGDQLICQKDDSNLVWDIIGIDHDIPADPQFSHSLTLQLHNIFQGVQFDEKEAFYYTASGLSAGTYKITVSGHDWVAADVGKTFQFTLTQAVPAGGQLVFTQAYNASLSTGSVKSYASSSATTEIETAAMSEGSSGTSLGSIDKTTVTDSMNCMQRALLGSSNYKASAIRQFLNSDKAAGSVWTPQTNFDRPPSWAASLKGFLNGLDADFLASVGVTKFKVTRNTVNESGGYDTLEDKFFLLGRENIFAGQENSIDEGGAYPYYSDYSDSQTATTGADKNRIKYSGANASWWWLRTPGAGAAYYPRGVYTDGGVNDYIAINSSGCVPACNII